MQANRQRTGDSVESIINDLDAPTYRVIDDLQSAGINVRYAFLASLPLLTIICLSLLTTV